jgi:uncharacterized protein YyaL (SSP411 family)
MPGITKISPFTATQRGICGKATAYVCRDRECLLPTNDVAVMLARLDAG